MENTTLKDVLKSDKHEDFVEYFVFPVEATMDDPQEQLFRINAAAQKIIGDYLWHNEPFGLRFPSAPLSHFEETDQDDDDKKEKLSSNSNGEKNDCSNTKYFYGITHFGDNSEDEWFIVHILKELTKQFTGIVVRVVDNDGEFILIEAADFLPSWAESDASCRQRVYFYEGKVHIIPKVKNSSKATTPLPSGTPTISQAVEAVRDHSESTLASDQIQKAISDRIGNYPEKMQESWHSASLMLPPKLAVILKERPYLVSAGALAFYNRDPVNLKTTRLMKNFKPGDSLVKTRVRFTRCLYAMLSKQDFRPDTRSGWLFPRPTSYEFKAHSLGAKLTTGFEILLSCCGNSRDESSSESENGVVSDSNPNWLRYEEALKKTGYFRGYLEGSKPYQQLQHGAKDFFLNNLSGASPDIEDTIVRELKKLMSTVEVDMELLKSDSENLPADDDDSWMDIKPEDLESLLEAKFQSGGLNPAEIPSKLKEFMKQISDFSGVEVPSSSVSDTPNSTSSSSPRGNGASESQLGDFGEPFDFKADEFVSALDKLLLDLGGKDKDFEASDDSYGSEEDDFDVNLEEIKKMHNFSKESMQFMGLMKQMDAELATTEVGKTFQPDSASAKSSSSSSVPKSNEAASSSKSGSKVATANVDELDEFDEEEGLTPVNIDMNALANILESFQSQDGPSGPSANLLRSVGFDISRMKK